jgi:hypothetical protein
MSAHDIAPSAPNSVHLSHHRHPRRRRAGALPESSIVRRYIKEVLQKILTRDLRKKSSKEILVRRASGYA